MSNHKEMNMPPSEFQERLTYLGNVNRYDEPNFRIWWSQYAYGDGSFRSGGLWTVDEAHYEGYRDVLRGSGEPCWCLGQWNPPEAYGTPEAYYIANRDEATGLQILGGYPYSGRVELLYNLRWYERDDTGRMAFRTMPLNTRTFDRVVPIILMAKSISWAKTKAAHQALLAKDEEDKTRSIERHLQDNAAPFGGSAVSFTRQGIRTTDIDRRMVEMQRMWNTLASSAASFKRGTQTR